MTADAVIAGVAGLLGVGLSGGVQAGLALRVDVRNRRGAVRMIEDELTVLTSQVQYASTIADPDGRRSVVAGLRHPSAYLERQEVLARELPERQWVHVSVAFREVAQLKALALCPDLTSSLLDEIQDVSVLLSDARVRLAPRRARRLIRDEGQRRSATVAEAQLDSSTGE